MEAEKSVISIFCCNGRELLFVLYDDGSLFMYDKEKSTELTNTQISRGDFDENGFAKVKITALPESAKFIEASVSGTTFCAKVMVLEGQHQTPKYSFELEGLFGELTPDELSIRRTLNGLEVSEDSKISCLDPKEKWLLATNINSNKVVQMVDPAFDIRSLFENAAELDYPFFMFYDPISGELQASNFEALFGKSFFENPNADLQHLNISEILLEKLR